MDMDAFWPKPLEVEPVPLTELKKQQCLDHGGEDYLASVLEHRKQSAVAAIARVSLDDEVATWLKERGCAIIDDPLA